MPSGRPTILQVLPQMRSGGVERGTVEIAEGLTLAGWGSLVASAGGPMTESLRRIGTSHIDLPLNSKNPYIIWRNAAALETIIRRQNVSIIHARSRAPAWSAWLAAQRTGIPLVTTFHGFYGLQNKWKQRYNDVMVRGDRVIAVSNFVAEHIRRHYAMDLNKLRIIPRGVDLRQFNSGLINGHRIMQLAEKWHVPDDKKIILMPGRITRWKGQNVLLDALALLPRDTFYCLMIGESSGHPAYLKELEELVIRHGLEGSVRFADSTRHMANAYGMCDLVVCPSVEPEAFGRVPVEAQAMGKPVIATAHGGALETVIHNDTGLLVPPGDAPSLAAAIDRMFAMPQEEKEDMLARAYYDVQNNFTTQRMSDATLAVYEELLAERARPRRAFALERA